jgi:hypothetical protein
VGGQGVLGESDNSGFTVFLDLLETPLGERFTGSLRITYLDYEIDDTGHYEDGHGTGMEGVFRFYPAGIYRGLYVAFGIGYWHLSYDWEERQCFICFGGSDNSDAVETNLKVGGKIYVVPERVYIEPSLQVGHFATFGGDFQDSELGFYGAGGVGFGLVF